MSTTYQASVTSYTGTISDTQNLTNVLSAGAKFIVDRIPEVKLDKYASTLTDAGSGYDITGVRVVRAHKGGYRARKVDPGLKNQVLPNGSLSTVSIVNGGSGYSVGNVLTLSQGTAGTCTVTHVTAGVVDAIEITTAGSSFTLGVKTTTVSPAGGTDCTIYVIPSNGSIHEATTIDPVYYEENTKGYVIPGGGTIVGVTYPDVAYGDDPSSKPTSFPPELKQGIVLYAVIHILLAKNNTILSNLDALAIDSITAPTAPNAASFSFSTTTYNVAAYSAGTFTPATIDVTSGTTIGALPTAPVYTAPTCTLTAAPSDLTLTLSVPTAPNAPSFTYTDAVIGSYTGIIIGSIGTPPTYTKPTTTFSLTNSGIYLATNEDIEKTGVEITRQNALLDQYGKDLYNELNEFNAELEGYKANLQKTFKQVDVDLQHYTSQGKDSTDVNIQNASQVLVKQIQEYQAKLGLYADDINSYGQQVNKAVQIFASNLQKWTVDRQTQLGQYSNDIQNAQNSFNKELAVYNAGVQKLIEQARLDQQRLIDQSQKVVELNKYNASEAVKTALANAQETTAVDIQNKAKALESDIVNKTKTLEASIQQYQSNLELYQAQIGSYGQDVNKAISKYQLNISKYSNEVQANTLLIQECRKELAMIVGAI